MIGGDYQGKGTVPNAKTTTIDSTTTIKADALQTGNGGKIIIWADDTTKYSGNISATFGTDVGDGGFAEVSGKQNLSFQGLANLSATHGEAGTLLLDPSNVIISDYEPQPNDPPEPARINATDLGQIAGNVYVSATNSISVLTYLNFVSPGNAITFLAGGTFSSSASIYASGRSVIVSAGNISVSNGEVIYTGTTDGSSAGSISLTSTSSINTGFLYADSYLDTSSLNSISSAKPVSGNTSAKIAKPTIPIANIKPTASIPALTTGNISPTPIPGGSISNPPTRNNTVVVNPPSSNVNSNLLGGGSGGNITLNANSGISITGASTYSNSGFGGSITLDTADGNIAAGDLFTDATNHKGGAVSLTSTNGKIGAGVISTADSSTGNGGGNITMNAKTGISMGVGAFSASNSGYSGNILLEAEGNISPGYLSSFSILGNGGVINVKSTNGNINAGANGIVSYSNSGNAGNVTLSAKTGISMSTSVFASSSSGNGGNITLNTALGNIETGYLISGSTSGNGGAIKVTSTSGNINAGINGISSNSGSGSAGNVTLTAGNYVTGGIGSITTGLIDVGANGNGNGGTVTLTAAGDINTSAVVSNSNGASGTSGDITLKSKGAISTLGETNDTTVRHVYAGGTGNVGKVTINAKDDITLGSVFAGSGTTNGNDIEIISTNGSIETGNDVSSKSDGSGKGGNIKIKGANDVITGEINAGAGNGLAGTVDIESTAGGIDTNGFLINTAAVSGAGGAITLNAANTISTASLESSSTSGVSGDISVTSTRGNIFANGGNTDSSSVSGTAGKITFEALSSAPDSGSITTGSLDAKVTSGSGSGGEISIRSGGNITSDYLRSDSTGGLGGNITLDAGKFVKVIDSFMVDDIDYSIYAGFGSNPSLITIKHGGTNGLAGILSIGDASTGLAGGILTSSSVILPAFEVFGNYTLGNINILSSGSTPNGQSNVTNVGVSNPVLSGETDLPGVARELAALIYAESRSESIYGQYLAGSVVYNRVKSNIQYPNNQIDFGYPINSSRIRGVIRKTNQFEGYDNGNNVDYTTFINGTFPSTIDRKSGELSQVIAWAALGLNQDAIKKVSLITTGVQNLLPVSNYVYFSADPDGFFDAPNRSGNNRYKYVTIPIQVENHYFQEYKPGFENFDNRIYTSED